VSVQCKAVSAYVFDEYRTSPKVGGTKATIRRVSQAVRAFAAPAASLRHARAFLVLLPERHEFPAIALRGQSV
jgi:hypothetical protein